MTFSTEDLKVLRLVCNTTAECGDCPENDLCDYVYEEVGEYNHNPQDWSDEDIKLRNL